MCVGDVDAGIVGVDADGIDSVVVDVVLVVGVVGDGVGCIAAAAHFTGVCSMPFVDDRVCGIAVTSHCGGDGVAVDTLGVVIAVGVAPGIIVDGFIRKGWANILTN